MTPTLRNAGHMLGHMANRMAGHMASHVASHMAGHMAGHKSGHMVGHNMAGHMACHKAGHMAGHMAGHTDDGRFDHPPRTQGPLGAFGPLKEVALLRDPCPESTKMVGYTIYFMPRKVSPDFGRFRA